MNWHSGCVQWYTSLSACLLCEGVFQHRQPYETATWRTGCHSGFGALVFSVRNPRKQSKLTCSPAVYQHTLATPSSDSVALLQVVVVAHFYHTQHTFHISNMQASCAIEL